MYSSITLVKQYSGLRKISDDHIRGEILRADSLIDSYLRQKYILPLPYRYATTISIARTGSTTGTLTLTVNGSAYSITVGATTTASQLADLFREEMDGSEDFYIDEVGSGNVVMIVSKSNSETASTAKAQVTTTETASVAGVTLTISVPTKKYPAFIEYLSASLARGQLLLQNFGAEEEGTSRDGSIPIAQAMQQLKRIQGVSVEEEELRIIDDYTGEILPTKTLPSTAHYPNSTSDADSGTSPEFSVNSRF